MRNPVESALGDDGTAHVAVLGEIDFSNADEVARALCDTIAEWSPHELRVDLHAASFIDSTGLGALIEGYQAAAERGTRFVVTNPTESFHRVLTITGLCEVFGMPAQDELTRSSATGA